MAFVNLDITKRISKGTVVRAPGTLSEPYKKADITGARWTCLRIPTMERRGIVRDPGEFLGIPKRWVDNSGFQGRGVIPGSLRCELRVFLADGIRVFLW